VAEGARDKSNEPAPLLGYSRVPELQERSLWATLKMWFLGVPMPGRQIRLPKPPRSVLAARTPTIVAVDDSKSIGRKLKRD
jgi:hypothetical protein